MDLDPGNALPAAAAVFRDIDSATIVLKSLTSAEIILAGQPTPFGRQDKRSRTHLLNTVMSLEPEIQKRIKEAAAGAAAGAATGSHKRRRLDPPLPEEQDLGGVHDSEFMQVQSPAVVQSCISRFIDRTSNAALRMVTCMVCARDLEQETATDVSVKDIPNPHLLVPQIAHADHNLVHGLLLHNQAVHDAEKNSAKGSVCHECWESLKKDKLPKLSLANGMWIGDTPFELSVLTLAEQILIARNYPAAYIVKLYPKKRGAKHLHRGLRGNVSTYRLDSQEIADMVAGNIMPPPSRILASIIGVTLVGPKNIPETTMPGFLKVRRRRVQEALEWLKLHNPLYANIEISHQRLSELENDGIPQEIIQTARHSDDTEILHKESAGYVPNDEDFDEDDFQLNSVKYGSLGAGGEFSFPV